MPSAHPIQFPSPTTGSVQAPMGGAVVPVPPEPDVPPEPGAARRSLSSPPLAVILPPHPLMPADDCTRRLHRRARRRSGSARSRGLGTRSVHTADALRDCRRRIATCGGRMALPELGSRTEWIGDAIPCPAPRRRGARESPRVRELSHHGRHRNRLPPSRRIKSFCTRRAAGSGT